MKTLFLICILLTFLYSDQNSSTVLGVQKDVKNPIKTFKQKDGSSFSGKSCGEAYFNYIELEDGHIALYNQENKQYEYALIKNGKLRPSGIPVNSKNTPKNIPKIPKQTLKQLEADAFKKHL
jgi:hypothetical protein